MAQKLTHIDTDGEAKMVDVSEKRQTERVAIAAGKITMKPETLNLIQQGRVKKGDALSVARLAGIMGAKKTSDLIPLCHPLALNAIEVELSPSPNDNSIEITASCKVKGRTGVEMEALNAVSIAALTVYDMCKAVDREMIIGNIRLIKKIGGKSGFFEADA
ncbi:MAG: cyclic pyranopterin monophosphate synthase MoaC [Pseudomonadota bacterium]|jgi:cyclic pyranopterin phosphate synthase|nr:cyclic pyranopterin monophosphate synthase MoaC [Pseudomonadota bacterium]